MRISCRPVRVRNVQLVFALMCFLALAMSGMTGCRVSDALTEVIYDQSADIIDYDNPTKIYVNDSTADQESDQFAAKEVSDDTDVVSDTVQNLVVYSSNPNTEGFTAKKSVFDEHPDFEGIEASEEVCFVKSSDPEAFDHPVTVEDPIVEEPDPEDEQEPIVQDEPTTTPPEEPAPAAGEDATSSDDPGWSDAPADDGWEEISPGDAGGGETSTTEPSEPTEPTEADNGGGNDNGETKAAYDATDPTAEPEKVNSIAAFGPLATIVQMVGGNGALAATDSETLAGNFSRVFDTSTIATGWSGDGSDASTIDVGSVIASGAGAVLVYSSDYLSDEDEQALIDAGVVPAYVYPLANSGNIKKDVSVVARMLAESSTIQYAGQTEARAADYESFHDRVVRAAADANGGLAGSAVYEGGSDSATPGMSSSTPLFTLFVDEFEESAYTGGTVNGWKPANGLAFASAGYNETPMSYYIQAGGLVNNAAAQTGLSASGKVVAWQFGKNNFPYRKKDWSGETASHAKVPDGYSLLTTTNNMHAIYPFGESFGSASFPRIIAKDADIKSKIIGNSEEPNSAYHPYDFTSNGVISMMGPDASLPACIGFNGNDASQTSNLFEGGGIDDESVVVNPRGLFCDWAQGSAESFLEAAWVSDVANGTGAPLGWRQEVADFYAQFYGYEITASDWEYIDPEGQ